MATSELAGADTSAARLEVKSLRQTLEHALRSEFAAVRAEIKSEVEQVREEIKSEAAQLRDNFRSQATALRNELMTRADDKLTTFSKTLPSSSTSAVGPEPSPLADVSFSGESHQLSSFLYSIYYALSVHEARFADDGRRVKWISRHFRPASSPAADWWLSLVAENASLFDESLPEGMTASFPFRLKKLQSVDAFLRDLVETFSDPFESQKALKALQELVMGKLGVQQFNTKFNALSYRVKGLNEAVLMDYYQRALSDRVRRQALGRPDWGPCRTVKDLQTVTLLAAKQLDDLSSTYRPVSHPSPVPMILVPRDPAAMDVDIHAAGLRMGKLVTPTVVTFTFYRELCHQRGMCWRCLRNYDEDHRSQKLNPSVAPCPHPLVDAARMDQFAKQCQSQPLPPPPPAHHSPVAALSAGPLPSFSHDGTPVMYYHSPPHMTYASHHQNLAPYPIVSTPFPHYPVHAPQAPYAVHAPPVPISSAVSSPVPLPVVEALPVAESPPGSLAAISAVFSEYADLDEPRYYDLPAGSSEDPLDVGFWLVP